MLLVIENVARTAEIYQWPIHSPWLHIRLHNGKDTKEKEKKTYKVSLSGGLLGADI